METFWKIGVWILARALELGITCGLIYLLVRVVVWALRASGAIQ